jgi:hypothetical protein
MTSLAGSATAAAHCAEQAVQEDGVAVRHHRHHRGPVCAIRFRHSDEYVISLCMPIYRTVHMVNVAVEHGRPVCDYMHQQCHEWNLQCSSNVCFHDNACTLAAHLQCASAWCTLLCCGSGSRRRTLQRLLQRIRLVTPWGEKATWT